MSDLRVLVAAHGGGWRFEWSRDGERLGEPIDVAAHDAAELGRLGATIAQAFENPMPDGYAVLPRVAASSLDAVGVELRGACCGPAAGVLADDGTHRLTVVSDVPAALNLPWELLPVGARGDKQLGCDRRWGVFRSPCDVDPPKPLRRGVPLRVLFLAAAPTDQHALDYEKEEEAILRATATLHGALLFTAELGSYEEMCELLGQVKPHVVHLSGHGTAAGGVGRFAFESEAGRTDLRKADDLADLFAQNEVECVFLNGCQTSQAAVAGLCQGLTAAGLPLALGWAASVADERATAFSETFYQRLLSGDSVAAAVAVARERIRKEGARRGAGKEEQELTFLLPQLYAAGPVEAVFDPQGAKETFHGVRTRYELLPGGVQGLREGFVGRRREQQKLVPALREGETTFLVLHGIGGQGKSTLATRIVDRLRGSGFDVRAVKTLRQGGEAASCAARACVDVVKEVTLAAKKLQRPDLAAMIEAETEPVARMELAADALAELKCVLVLDNFEDVLEQDGGAWRIADDGLAAFYSRAQTQLTHNEGGRVVVTSRYLPAGTRGEMATVDVVEGLLDFKDYEFFKLLKRDKTVADRIRRNDLPMGLLRQLYQFVGGTPRFLERILTLLKKLGADELEDALKSGGGVLEKERDKYLEAHFGPRLFAQLSEDARRLAGRSGVSGLFLPDDALASLTGLGGDGLEAAVRQAVEAGLLQVLEEPDSLNLYLPPGVWRGWLAGRLGEQERREAHGVLAAFWREACEKKRAGELRVGIEEELQECRRQAKQGGNGELWRWSSVILSRSWERIAEWRAARDVLEEIPETERDGDVWHNLAGIDVREGKYAEAREKFAIALAIKQQIGDRAGEAATLAQLGYIEYATGNYEEARKQYSGACETLQQVGDRAGEAATWHCLATIDVNEGKYAEARQGFARSLAMLQQIGDRAGEAATWHQLASIDVKEGKYAEARQGFARSLAIKQQIGDRAGEAATWHQLASIDVKEGKYAEARQGFARSLAIKQQIGDRAGEAATWHQLASIDVNEGKHAEARQGFARSLAIKQQIGDRAGEAATWHQLASIDVNEGKHAEARQGFARSLAMLQQIGDRAGEAATFYQLGAMAHAQGRLLEAAKLVGLCFGVFQSIGDGQTQFVLQNLLGVCEQLSLTQEQVLALLQEIAASYQQDRGASLLREAFPDS